MAEIVIPAAYRKALGLRAGDILTVQMDNKGLHLQTKRQALFEAQDLVSRFVSAERSLSEELIQERREAFRREEEESG